MDSFMPADGVAGQGAGTSRRLAMRRDAPVTCLACGRVVARKARNQRYCSLRCRGRAKEKARNRTRKAGLGGYTGAPTTAANFASKINELQGRKLAPNPLHSDDMDVRAKKALATLRWPGWSEADYLRAMRGAKAWVVNRSPAGKARKATPIARPIARPTRAHAKLEARAHAAA
jgi:hypothetical protein